MKYKISISVEETTLDEIDASVKEGKFRSRSHAFEYGLKKLLKGEQNG